MSEQIARLSNEPPGNTAVQLEQFAGNAPSVVKPTVELEGTCTSSPGAAEELPMRFQEVNTSAQDLLKSGPQRNGAVGSSGDFAKESRSRHFAPQTEALEIPKEGRFALYPSKDVFSVRLTSRSISWERQNRERHELSTADIVGSVCMRKTSKNHESSAFFAVYAYPLKKKDLTGRSFARKRVVHAFEIAEKPDYDSNLTIANEWREHVFRSLKTNREKRLLVFINPFSGPGRAQEIFHHRVRPILAEAGMVFDVVITERAGHAREFVESDQKLHRLYGGIVIVSGDGLIHEVYNGLYGSAGSKENLRLPLGVIPGGSGNALAKSIHSEDPAYNKQSVMTCALTLIWGQPRPMDLMLVTLNGGPSKLVSFLSVGYGLLSDIDIESEKLRMLGELRFTLWALARIAALRGYDVKLSYDEKGDGNWVVEEGEMILVYAVVQKFVSSDVMLAPKAELNDGNIWLLYIKKEGVGKTDMLKLMTSLEDGSFAARKWVHHLPVKRFKLEPKAKDRGNLTIDGEAVPVADVEVELLVGAAKVFARS